MVHQQRWINLMCLIKALDCQDSIWLTLLDSPVSLTASVMEGQQLSPVSQRVFYHTDKFWHVKHIQTQLYILVTVVADF